MNIHAILFGLLLALTPLSFVQRIENSFQSSKLPKIIPAGTTIKFNEGGGMVRSYKSISISENTLDFEELKGGEQSPTKWTVKISEEDKDKLYQVFVKNEFDLIENDARKNIVYDAGSESVSLTVNDETYNKTYGLNSPMSGISQKHYRAVSGAINDLADLYAKKGERIADNYTVLNYDSQSYNQIFNNATATTLDRDEITMLSTLLKKAVDEHNASVKSANEKIDLSRYKFQYLPVINDKNEKLVFINSFCDDFDGDWRTRLVTVFDGGKCFFNLKVNLSVNKYFDFMVNGYA